MVSGKRNGKWAILDDYIKENYSMSSRTIARLIKSEKGELFTQKEDNLASSIRKRRRLKSFGGGSGSKAKSEAKSNEREFDVNGDKAMSRAVRRNAPFSIDEMAEIFDVDVAIWKAVRKKNNSWTVTNAEGEQYINWQTIIWWERDAKAEMFEYARGELFKELKKIAPPKKTKPLAITSTANLLEVDMRDIHLGKLCWGLETGDDYDLKIATERALSVVKDLIGKGLAFGFDRVLLCASDDFINIDNMEGMTTSGTAQDNDGRHKKIFKTGVWLQKAIIDGLSEHAPVDVVFVPGNHDRLASFYLGEVLEAWYYNNPNVTIINNEAERKYYEYGNVLLGFAHGDGLKMDNLPILMAQEAPAAWGRTKFREYHIGHLHSRKEMKWLSSIEKTGVVVRQMRSLSGTDYWHYSKGFVGSVKGAEAFIWNKDTGLNAMFESNLVIERENHG